MKGNPALGARYLIRGLQFLGTPGIRAFVIVPLLLNIIIFGVLIRFSLHQFSGWLEVLLGWIPDWLGFIRWVLWPLFFALILFIAAYTFTIVANFIASPFNGLLSEKAEQLLTGSPLEETSGWRELPAMIPRALIRELAKLLYYLRWLILIGLFWLLSFIIPVLAPLLPVAWFVFGAWMMAMQYCDYPYDNHQFDIPSLRADLRSRTLTTLGFGGAITFATLIPLLNLLIMPAAVCGATIYWVEELQGQRQAN